MKSYMNWEKLVEIPIAPYQNILIVYGNSRAQELSVSNSVLTSAEREYARRIRAENQRETWISCHVTLRLILATYLGLDPVGIEFKRNHFGRPYLPDSNLYFNISHTNDSYLLGFSHGGRVGIDLEKLNGTEDLDSLMDYAFSPQEIEYCANEQKASRFLDVWTLKEAFLKAEGVGLVDNLSSINVIGDKENDIAAKNFHHRIFICPNGETGSIVSRNREEMSCIHLI